MTDMRDDDWRRNDQLTEAEIRQMMESEGWEAVEAVGVHVAITTAPKTYLRASSVSPASVKLKQVPQPA